MSDGPKSKFLKVKCSCGNNQVVFGKASTKVKCLSCGKLLVKPSGGKSVVTAKVEEII
jgi:small subunit ribosomal protein S27e